MSRQRDFGANFPPGKVHRCCIVLSICGYIDLAVACETELKSVLIAGISYFKGDILTIFYYLK